MISSIFFVTQKGDTLISRTYRDNIKKQTVDKFIDKCIKSNYVSNKYNPALQYDKPVVCIDAVTFIYIQLSNIFLVCTTLYNSNAMMYCKFLHEITVIFNEYFQCHLLNEQIIYNNYIKIYEIFDEVCDYGYPQILSLFSLKSYIKADNITLMQTVQSLAQSAKSATTAQQQRTGMIDTGITNEITGAVDWRQAGKYRYRKNETFIDLIESINILISKENQILEQHVLGNIIMKTYLTGMPECKLILNDKLIVNDNYNDVQYNKPAKKQSIQIDNFQFHRCVKLNAFETDKQISFIPPDGEFELLNYRISENINLPFTVKPNILYYGKTRIEVNLDVTTLYPANLNGQNIVINIPIPPNFIKNNQIKISLGKLKWNSEKKLLQWKIKKLPGDTTISLRGDIQLVTGMNDIVWQRPPITLDFMIPMFSATKLSVKQCKVYERSNYETTSWYTFMCRNGKYEIRI